MPANRLGEHEQMIRIGPRLAGSPSFWGLNNNNLLWRTVLELYDQENLQGAFEIAKTLGEGRDARGGITFRLIEAELESEADGVVQFLDDHISVQYLAAELGDLMPHICGTIKLLVDDERARFGWTEQVPVKVTFLSEAFDEWWAPSRYGYCAEKVALFKICIPHHAATDPNRFVQVFRHEFAHVISLSTSKGRISKWLGEGFSVHAEGNHNERARQIFLNNPYTWLGPEELELQFGPGIDLGSMEKWLAYEQGGYIVRYLAGAKGDKALVQFFRDFADEGFFRNLKLVATGKPRTQDAVEHFYGLTMPVLFERAKAAMG